MHPRPGQALLEASAKGGRVTQWRGVEVVQIPGQVETAKDVLEVLSHTPAGIWNGTIPPGVGGSICYVCNTMLATIRLMHDTRETRSSGPILVRDQDFDGEDAPMSPERKRLTDELDRD